MAENYGEITMQWHLKSIEDAFKELGTSAEGLSQEEASSRLLLHGPNELLEKKKKTALVMFLDQFKDFMILVLIAAAAISGIIGEATDTIAIIVIVVLNAVIGFVQEYRAEKAMAALRKMTAPNATVIRGGAHAVVPAAELVPGDMVYLEAGNVVPADVRVVESAQLRVDEAALTGESVPVQKHHDTLHDEHSPIGDRLNMGYKGTLVTYGRGTGVVVGTGMETELGRIAAMLQEGGEVKTPLQRRLAQFGKKLSVAIFVICAIVFTVGVLRGEQVMLMLLTAISLAVAAIPEALPAVITISLALGAKKLVRQNALIRKLPAVETLGSVTYICSDKTGTMTLNKMAVQAIYVGSHRLGAGEHDAGRYGDLFAALALSNDARTDAEGNVMGDPTEVALYNVAHQHGYDRKALEAEFPRVAEIPFDSDRKCMTTLHKWHDGKFVSFTKGAVDVLVRKAINVLTPEGLKDVDALQVQRTNEGMAADGLRVLGLAMREWDTLPEDVSAETAETGLTILGMAGMMDPPRPEVRQAVATCRMAGIKPVMITGDHPITARAVARQLGIVGDAPDELIEGVALKGLSIEEFEARVEHISVYARVAPEQKLMIVKALQDKGQFVAMTGDGVNDAPALRRADIGVAMGITGTDVAKEASDMVLRDDNFTTIIGAIKEGRRIFDNIRKFIKYTMSSNTGEIWTLFLAPLIGLPVPLLPIHILWINLATDGLPGLALAAEPTERGVMKRPPRHPKESIFAHGLGAHMIWVGLLMGFVAVFSQAWFFSAGNPHWQTMVFTVLCLSQLGNAMAVRSTDESLFSIGLFSNKYMLGAVVLTLALQMAIIYVPFLNTIFKTAPLSAPELAIALALSTVVFVAVEVEKLVRRRLSLRHKTALS